MRGSTVWYCTELLLTPPGRPWKATDNKTYRGYYMAERRDEISLLVLTKIFFQHGKRNFVSPSDHVMFYLLY